MSPARGASPPLPRLGRPAGTTRRRPTPEGAGPRDTQSSPMELHLHRAPASCRANPQTLRGKRLGKSPPLQPIPDRPLPRPSRPASAWPHPLPVCSETVRIAAAVGRSTPEGAGPGRARCRRPCRRGFPTAAGRLRAGPVSAGLRAQSRAGGPAGPAGRTRQAQPGQACQVRRAGRGLAALDRPATPGMQVSTSSLV